MDAISILIMLVLVILITITGIGLSRAKRDLTLLGDKIKSLQRVNTDLTNRLQEARNATSISEAKESSLKNQLTNLKTVASAYANLKGIKRVSPKARDEAHAELMALIK